MSYDVSLEDESGTCVAVDRHTEGGTYAVGGTVDADLNVTYNYSWFYFRYLDKKHGLRWLSGKRASETIEKLEAAVKELGDNTYEDYWAPTPGNAGYALAVLLGWAKQYPDATWRVV